MKRRLRAEFLRLGRQRLVWIGLGVAAAAGALAAVSHLAGAGRAGNPSLGPDSFGRVIAAVPTLVIGAVALLLGVIGVAGEVHHRTIATTFVVTPRRGRVVAAKVVAHVVLGVLLVAVAVAATAAVAGAWLAADGAGIGLDWSRTGARLAGSVGALASYSAVGVGVGALVGNQTAAVAGVAVWVMGIEQLLVGVLHNVGVDGIETVERWLPGTLARVVARAASERGELSLVASAALLAAFTGVVVTLGARRLIRRDIT